MSYPPRSEVHQSKRQTAFHYPSSIHSSTSNTSPTLPSFSSSPTLPIPQLKSTTSLSNLFEENHPDLPPPPRKRRFHFVHPAQWNWRKAEDVLWASLPLIFHLTAIGLLSFALFQSCVPYISIVQVVGGGRVDYGIYRSCTTLPITGIRSCTPFSLQPSFAPSLAMISTDVPGFALLQAPLTSFQTPVIFFSAYLTLLLSFLIFVFPWSLAYFPKLPYPPFFKSLLLNHSKKFYELSSLVVFISLLLNLTIAVGYKLYNQAATYYFTAAMQAALYSGQVGLDGTTDWIAVLGSGYDVIYAASVFQGLTLLGLRSALHNRIDLKIERAGEEKNGGGGSGYY